MSDTIYALSSGRPPAAIAVVRISGSRAQAVVGALSGGLPPPRHAGLRAIRDAAGALLDRALVLSFPGPHSATGEDLVEIHAHGGRAVVAAIEAALADQGLRRADPGELTRRALTAGRIDLAEAHGLADLLEAETEAERRAALDAVEGRISQLVGGWLHRLAGLSAQVEAMLDYADEEDVGGDAVLASVDRGRLDLTAAISDVLAAPAVERLRDGVRVVIGGPPNAGKSTLINLLVQRDAAIVSPIAGTTRDRIEAQVVRQGIAYTLTDTAGLTDTDDPVEAIGVTRAGEAIEAADLLLWLGDATPPRADALWIHAQSDRPGRDRLPAGRALAVAQSDSASIDRLWDLIAARVAPMMTSDRPSLREHQRQACGVALRSLAADSHGDPVVMAEHIRLAHRALATIVGVDATEAMLDNLFGRFCIGK